MDFTIVGSLVGHYGGVIGATKIIVDLIKSVIDFGDKKKVVLPILSIVIAGFYILIHKKGLYSNLKNKY